ncbi:UNVERIFIED_CONTAM: hypothetical protein Q9R58_25155 [Methylobacteriaceae bacterium AG10]|uniref:hypothetical protein n=1 Tax=Methylobacterium fujisawaense TaxID=107400 RepID=UPI002937B87E|nr:hypothetical protein [Methylobacteriaceae bacterium AG10]
MSVMNSTLWSATGSFGLQDAHAMVKKAWREFERSRNADEDDNRRDAALNCAMTVWHVCDWAWAGMAAQGRWKPEFLQLLGVVGRNAKKEDFVAWAVRECPALEICQSICNGTKHVHADRAIRTKTEPGVQTGDPVRMLLDDGTDRDIFPILEEAVYFWIRQATNEAVML